MNMRKITSLTALLSFIVLILNSVILYIVPHGRIAFWADWQLWGLDKAAWEDQHIIIGVLFLVAIFLHIYYNWKVIVSYLKNKAKELKFFNKEFNIAMIVTIVCVIGSYFTVPPFSWVLDFGESIKDSAAVKYGIPPYGQAQDSTLKTLAQRTGFDLNRGIENLKKAGIRFENERQTLLEIAQLNRMTPQQVYLVMYPTEKTKSVAVKMPETPAETSLTDPQPKVSTGTGWGRKTLADVCREHNLDPTVALQKLAAKGISAKTSDSIRTLAEKNNLKPSYIFEIMK